MHIRYQLICAHTALVWAVITCIALFLMTGWLPPFSPGESIATIKLIFSDNTMSRIGFAIAALGAPLFLGLCAVIMVQMRRIEGEYHILADIQFGVAVLGAVELLLPPFFWLAISYRPELIPSVVAVFNDLGWFLFLGGVGPAIIQNLVIGFCILGDKKNIPVYPRWLGYFNIWIALSLVPGVLLPFFFNGPFAWNGFIGFWLVAGGFFLWWLTNYAMTIKAIKQQAAEENR